MNLNELRDKVYQAACAKGWHDKEYSNEHWLMMVVTELSEAVEADRIDSRANRNAFEKSLAGFKHVTKSMFNRAFEDFIKGTVEEEIADTVIRLLDLAGLKGIDLEELEKYDFETPEFSDLSFSYCTFGIIRALGKQDYVLSDLVRINVYITLCFANHLNIDIEWYISQKMQYNETRPHRHNKKY